MADVIVILRITCAFVFGLSLGYNMWKLYFNQLSNLKTIEIQEKQE